MYTLLEKENPYLHPQFYIALIITHKERELQFGKILFMRAVSPSPNKNIKEL